MKRLNTNKLFYGKYSYKLIWVSPIANWFRGADLPYIRETLDSLQRQYNQEKQTLLKIHLWAKTINISLKDLHYAQIMYSALCRNKNYRVRVEGKTMIIYAEQVDWLLELIEKLGNTVEELWEPNTLIQPNTVIMTPKMTGWEYRLTFKGKIPDEFKRWALKNSDKIRIGPTLRNIIETETYSYAHGLYFYVKNEKTISLVSLMLGNSISRIDKIIVEEQNE